MMNELSLDLGPNNKSKFFDWEVEKELNRIENMSFMNKSIRGNITGTKEFFFKDDINLEEYDQIFLHSETDIKKEQEKKKPQTSRNKETKVKVDIDEINKFYRDYEKAIEDEINKELEVSFKPMDFIPESDKERATRLIKNCEFLKRGIEVEQISYEDVVYFVDYYEMLSLMESKKNQAVDTLHKISELYTEDETWHKLQNQLERTLNQTNMILDNKIDMKKLLYEYSKNIEENKNKEKEKVKPKLNSNVDLSTDSYSNYSNSNKSKNKPKTKNLEQVNTEHTFTTKGYTGNKLLSHRGNRGKSVLNLKPSSNNLKIENFEKNVIESNNKLRESHSSIKTSSVISGVSASSAVSSVNNINTSRNNSKRVELFDEKNKMANLYKFRKDRREILKATMGGKSNTRPDLFKFNINTQLKDMSRDNKFMELLQMPKKLLDHIDETQQAPSNRDSPNKGSNKNTIRKRIEDAVNFSKKKIK